MNSLKTDDIILINAPVEKVWDVLTNPQLTPKYMYGCKLISNFRIGEPVLWKGVEDGVLYVKGELVEWKVNNEFTYTVIDPNGKYEDVPENYLTVTCQITKTDKGTQLQVSQGDYALVADGEERYKHATDNGGWSSVLTQIKEIAEG